MTVVGHRRFRVTWPGRSSGTGHRNQLTAKVWKKAVQELGKVYSAKQRFRPFFFLSSLHEQKERGISKSEVTAPIMITGR